jgi:hypothetical protein
VRRPLLLVRAAWDDRHLHAGALSSGRRRLRVLALLFTPGPGASHRRPQAAADLAPSSIVAASRS